jgi:hypothetical protein
MKVTLSLPARLLRRIDRLAGKADIAEEDRALAKAHLPLVAETLPPPYRRRVT